jgi:hypothetical protein
VAIHAGAVAAAEVAIFIGFDALDHETQRSAAGLALGCGIIRHVADGSQAHERERGHRRAVGWQVAALRLRIGFFIHDVTGGLLLSNQPADGLVHRCFDLGRDQLRLRCLRCCKPLVEARRMKRGRGRRMRVKNGSIQSQRAFIHGICGSCRNCFQLFHASMPKRMSVNTCRRRHACLRGCRGKPERCFGVRARAGPETTA